MKEIKFVKVNERRYQVVDGNQEIGVLVCPTEYNRRNIWSAYQFLDKGSQGYVLDFEGKPAYIDYKESSPVLGKIQAAVAKNYAEKRYQMVAKQPGYGMAVSSFETKDEMIEEAKYRIHEHIATLPFHPNDKPDFEDSKEIEAKLDKGVSLDELKEILGQLDCDVDLTKYVRRF